MEVTPHGEILRVLKTLPDTRRHNVRHPLGDLLILALFAVLCGADGWVAVVSEP